MEVFTVSLFGHRKVDDLRWLEGALFPIIKELIRTKPYISFLIGRNGEFDEYVASMIKHAQKELGKDNNEIMLVLSYKVANLEYYQNYYDAIIMPECVYGAHPKCAITLKNRWMVEQSDLVIVYVVRNNGGAYTSMKYAEKRNKRVINLKSVDRNCVE